MRTALATPTASLLILSLRDVGYSLETAIADVIDNSITAGARTVQLLTRVDESGGAVGILDDGEGMSEARLLDAMRMGCRNPLDERPATDLGRFGLGLKTASLSQCRRLTVVTRRDGVTSAARWDLDSVIKDDAWLVQIPDDPVSVPWANRIGPKGTLVLWEHIDRLLEHPPRSDDHQHFAQQISNTCSHLALVFHRFLAGEPGLKKLRILVNDRPLDPFDPFAERHPATIPGPLEVFRLAGADIKVQAFTLPHHRHHASNAEWEHQGGPGGYLKNQGFYVYRERRLILWGTWFGLARKSELTKLARVRVDVPSALDTQWKVDVKKATAQPPPQVKRRLHRIVDPILAGSKRVYTFRGTKLADSTPLPLWQRIRRQDSIHYRINADHPALTRFVTFLPEDVKQDFRRILELVAAAVPVDSLFADFGADPSKLGSDCPSDATVERSAILTYDHLADNGLPHDEILAMMKSADPFLSHWPSLALILEARRLEREQ